MPPSLIAQVLEEFASYLDAADTRFDVEVTPEYLRGVRQENERLRSEERRISRRCLCQRREMRECACGCGRTFVVLLPAKGRPRIYFETTCRWRAWFVKR
jgi:hypothetical protein